jgi:hypothetical protein
MREKFLYAFNNCHAIDTDHIEAGDVDYDAD